MESVGERVVAVDCLLPDSYDRQVKERNWRDVSGAVDVSFWEADLRTDTPSTAFRDVNTVVHLAAMPGQALSWSRTDLYTSCNVLATQRLLDQAVAEKVKHFIYVSTSSVYGKLALGDESAPEAPVSPYGVTKLAGEHLVRAYGAEFGLPYSILRFFSVYGPRQRPDMAFARFIAAMRRGQSLAVYSDGRQTRASTYVLDAVQAIMLCIRAGAQNQAINISGFEQVPLLDVVDVLSQEIGVTPKLEFGTEEVGDQRHTAPNIGLAKSLLGYSPLFDLRQGLRAQVEWSFAQEL